MSWTVSVRLSDGDHTSVSWSERDINRARIKWPKKDGIHPVLDKCKL
jgi:translation initiation factor IF-1